MTDTNLLYPLPYATVPTDSASLRGQAAPWWSGPSTQERQPVLLWVVGAVFIIGMLIAFVQVVNGAVEQGAARRVATAAQLASNAACTAKRGPSAQSACRTQLAAASGTTNLIALR